ncbi:MAG: phosphoribosylformylglycinamidine synthase subunit PurL [Acidimicrobiia bacterium]|nr:phosphoribosylformylglycinamidine synthase subunit PurL [Acidimicrobiia bacterium]
MTTGPQSPQSIDEPVLAIVVGPGHVDTSANGLLAQARLFGHDVERIEQYRLVHVLGKLDDEQVRVLIDNLLLDVVDGWAMAADEHAAESGDRFLVDVGLRPGVTDREAAELVRAADALGIGVEAAAVGRRFVVTGSLAGDELARLADDVLHNEVIERWAPGVLPPAFTDPTAKAPGVDVVALRALTTDDELTELSRSRRLGLSAAELAVIRRHFTELGRDPTDAELETLAQTWSEHCSHKTFRGLIATPDGPIDGLLQTYLRAATDAIDAPWVRSAFVDNAGIVAFDDQTDVALKAETHNHPSALEPFGGANTGVGGVVRDILGVSAKPVAITDILCFGPGDVAAAGLPPGVLHPQRIRSGVIAGIGDYGNKIGVPTIAGAIVHDETYTTTPLVFAGCIGVLPTGSHPTSPNPGDAIVVLGGAVGRDGVGGATFSSQTMGAETAEIAGSSVQIGDPIVEKGLIDVVLEARDRRLYTAITDCGAGGLSSAVGEMAEQLGAEVDLATVPRKYPGLAPWEVWLSEAQERMVLAAPEPDAVLRLAHRWQVGAAVIGHFTGDGRLLVRDGDETVVELGTEFLHGGRPRLELTAAVLHRTRRPRTHAAVDPRRALLDLLAHPSIRSNEAVVRTYDHEVLGGTFVRPYGGVGHDAPADGTVLVPPGTAGDRALAVGIGVNVVIGRYDTEAMAWAAVDEAVRNVVAAGADPAQLSLLDNFAWGNPTKPDALARLVAACRGCHDAALAHGAPFVSGKDSLYNEFVGPDGAADPVTPTLVITAVGIVPDLEAVPLTGVVEAGDDIWLVGPARGALGGSHLDDVIGRDLGGPVAAPDPDAVGRHREVHQAIRAGLARSVHDLSEGGLAVAAAEWALGGRLGLELLTDQRSPGLGVLFGEGSGRYLIEVAPTDRDAFAAAVPSATRIGTVTETPTVRIGDAIAVSLAEVATAYTGHDRPGAARAPGPPRPVGSTS